MKTPQQLKDAMYFFALGIMGIILLLLTMLTR